jgi:hypothetical protein
MEKTTRVKVTKAGSLNWGDVIKGLVMAVLTPVLVVIQQSIEKGELTFNWHLIALSAVGGGVAYLLKNFFTTSIKEV